MQQRRQAVMRPFKPGFVVPHDIRNQGLTDLRSVVRWIDIAGPCDPPRRDRLDIRHHRHTGAVIRGPAPRPAS